MLSSSAVWNCELAPEGMLAGFIIEGAGLGGGTCEGRGPLLCRITSFSSRSESRSEMSPSAGSLSRSLSLTSSMRACDIVGVVGEKERSRGGWMVG